VRGSEHDLSRLKYVRNGDAPGELMYNNYGMAVRKCVWNGTKYVIILQSLLIGSDLRTGLHASSSTSLLL
jgi:hypothetical protein